MKCILIGNGGHCKVIKNIIKLMGYIIDHVYDDHDQSCDGTINDLINITTDSNCKINLVIAIGNNNNRMKVKNRLEVIDKSINYINCIHPSAIIAEGVKIGIGNCICAGTIIEPDSLIGNFNILNTNCSVNHDCIIDNFTHIAPHASLCGGVHIKEGVLIATGVNIILNIVIEKWCKIGVGAVILSSVLSTEKNIYGIYKK